MGFSKISKNHLVLCLLLYEQDFLSPNLAWFLGQREENHEVPDLGSKERELSRSSHTGDKRMHSDLLPSRRERKNWGDQEQWGFEDEKVAGVHWGYEETRTLLAILSQTEFYEALRNCHRNSQVYGAVAERLREYGFLRTLEQCRTKFKGLQKSYRKVKGGHPPETCPFFEEMEALMSAQVIALPSNGMEEEAAAHPGLVASDAETEDQEHGAWQQEEEVMATAEDSEGEEVGAEEAPRSSGSPGAPVLFQSPRGKIYFILGAIRSKEQRSEDLDPIIALLLT
uniref:Myb/SANT-like DNA-binding domain-containing protein n=1 Tax=Monodelphis domestica TaxID=13616 RepID=A0A5F8G5T7_MONDO